MRWHSSVGLVSTLLWACSPPPAEPSEGETGGDTDAPTEAPAFLDPVGGELTISVDRTDDLVLEVADVRSGLTRVFLDERSIGGAVEPDGLVMLTPEAFTLRLSGALVPGDHVLQLQTLAGDEALISENVLLDVLPVQVPSFEASLDDAIVFEADAIDAHGHGDDGMLFGIDLSADPVELALAPAQGVGWDVAAVDRIELPGFQRTDEPRFTVTAVGRRGDPEDPDDDRVRVAWRAGFEGDTVLAADAPWPIVGINTQTAVTLDPWRDETEYALLGRPLMLGETLVVEALLATDVETPRPGDRTVLTSRLDGEPGKFGPPQRSAVASGRDLDGIAPVRDLLTHRVGGTPGFSARVSGLRTVAFELDRVTGAITERATVANDRYSILTDATGPIQTIVGAFSTRQAFIPLGGSSPRVFLQHFEDDANGRSENASPEPAQLESLTDISAPVTSTVVAGLPVYLIPQGVDDAVVAIVSGGPTPAIRRLEGLACDELAVPVTDASADTRSIEVACRRGRDVSMGRVEVLEAE